MKLFYDLHIHSALSPCGDNDMTPNNIVNMSIIKGLDVIAVSDHNSIKNLYSIMEVAKNTELLVIPAMEIETAENIHILALFPDLNSAEIAYNKVYQNLPDVHNDASVFGEQLVMDNIDQIVGEEPKLLVNSIMLDFDDVVKLIRNVGGIAIPAHVDRSSYSVLSNLGAVPDMDFKYLELSKNANEDMYLYLGHKFIRNSDAHYLYDIFEAENSIECNEKTIESFFDALSK